MHADRLPSHSAHLAPSAQAELSGVCGQGLYLCKDLMGRVRFPGRGDQCRILLDWCGKQVFVVRGESRECYERTRTLRPRCLWELKMAV